MLEIGQSDSATIDPSPFTRVENNQSVIPLLKSRCPYDAHVLNMAILYPNFTEYMNIYIWNVVGDCEIGNKTWIVITSIREDFGRDICISMPPGIELTNEVKETLSNSKIFHWDESHLFIAIGRPLSKMITEINTHIKGNQISISPCKFYYIDPTDAIKLKISQINGVTVKPLDGNQGANFIWKNWRYSTERTLDYMKRFMAVNPSCGVFCNDKDEIISGIVISNNGVMGMLFTRKEYRNKQYGTLVMKSLMKNLGLKGLFPCSTADFYNDVSTLFHTKIGMKFSHNVDYVKFCKPNYED